MNANRRTFLRAAGLTGVVGLAGCSTLLGSPPDLVLTVENYRSDDVRLLVNVLDEDATDYDDGTVYHATVTVPAATGDDRWREPAVAPARQYRIEVVSASSRPPTTITTFPTASATTPPSTHR